MTLFRTYRGRRHLRRAVAQALRAESLYISAYEHAQACDRLLDQSSSATVLALLDDAKNRRGRLALVRDRLPGRPCLAGPILLAALAGMVICTLWIAITWRAMS